ncbi:DHA2 family efflux MFS transporter permease subunit [Sphingomonas morindae]|uniref:DHA2 family efflux MFS transporter permease subunit n=1 Tax=Sphingomonas morindae TaxID=1541170 RepID=A0ABY4XCA6_9SPHN|nr:DHA2 family efflux MFS transporter permease subunit [Sphingomonas morindae]USI74376.1 DHA2 family efflux MFS transporter permease subunit [Sphingomonas morindae]
MAGAGGWTPARSAAGRHNPWLIIIVISLATFMEVLDTSIANVALTHIAGSLAVSEDEATWVLTSYLVANAVVVPISGWLSEVVGRKRFYMISVALFTGASVLCGFAPSLGFLVVARILQGIGGGGLAPSEQSIIADTFPPAKRGLAFAAYGVVVIVAPTLGPTLGGWITDNLSWHWIFLINGPVGVLSLMLVQVFVAEPKALQEDRRRKLAGGLRVDVIGFALVALGLGCLEVTLDRGQREDWFSSPLILGMAVTSAVSLILLVTWELLHDEPIVNIRLFGNRNFALSTFMMLMVGAIIFSSTQIIPQMLQSVFGYTATLAGLALTTGGFGALAVMPLVGVLTGKVQTRWLLAAGFSIQALAMWHLSTFSNEVAFHQLGLARLIQAIGLPLLFIPITNQAYADLKPNETGDASALLNVARNIGGSIGISAAQAIVLQRQQFHQSRLVEGLNPLNPEYTLGLGQIGQMLGGAAQAANSELGVLYQQVQQQAAMLSYIDVFRTLAICVLCVIPLTLALKPASGGGH